ncbi:MAG TPA: ATP-dependent protease ATPase subunit HslU [Balneolales bacterium]|nr:ATP-dependent protease ATPase subunit HslU [Balneolales bacterium]
MSKTKLLPIDSLTPRQIVDELNKYIIGQDEAKKSVAIALRNRWRRMNAEESIRDEILPNNIILIGPTGVGKTEIARRLARLAKAPFIKVEASKFTEVGYVGRDVESMIRDLTDIAVTMVKNEMQERVKKKAAEKVEERILDLLIPPVKKPAGQSAGFNSDSTDDDFHPENASDYELNQRTREKFREKLRKGELDDRKIELEVAASNPANMQIFGPAGMEEMGINIQDFLGNLSPKKTKKKEVTIDEARNILIDEESEKLIDHDAAINEALERVQTSGIVFVDEIDKIAAGTSGDGRSGGPDVSRQGVQRDLLPIVEGSNVSTKYGIVKTDHVLFIASGAFHVAKPSDLIPELQGRFPIRVEMTNLSEEDFYKILTIPQNALIKQYQAMMESENINLKFDDESIREIAKIAAEVNETVENIGARRLHTILSTVLEELLYVIPDDIKEGEVTIDKPYVDKQLGDIITNRDLSHYIL